MVLAFCTCAVPIAIALHTGFCLLPSNQTTRESRASLAVAAHGVLSSRRYRGLLCSVFHMGHGLIIFKRTVPQWTSMFCVRCVNRVPHVQGWGSMGHIPACSWPLRSFNRRRPNGPLRPRHTSVFRWLYLWRTSYDQRLTDEWLPASEVPIEPRIYSGFQSESILGDISFVFV